MTVTSASANPLLVEKLMSKCLKLDKLDGECSFKYFLFEITRLHEVSSAKLPNFIELAALCNAKLCARKVGCAQN